MYSLALTTYNRPEMTIEAFDQVINDPRISEVVIVDDCSKDLNQSILETKISNHKYREKVITTYNEKNMGMMVNKQRAIKYSQNDWVIIFDSDNIIDKSYLNAIPEKLNPEVIYCPSFAKPHFDYRKFSGWLVGPEEAKKMVKDNMGNACLNTCNYLVHRETYLSVWENDPEVKGTDTISFAIQWLKAGKRFYIVPSMEYNHRVHNGSGFMQDAEFNMKKAEEYKQKILQL